MEKNAGGKRYDQNIRRTAARYESDHAKKT